MLHLQCFHVGLSGHGYCTWFKGGWPFICLRWRGDREACRTREAAANIQREIEILHKSFCIKRRLRERVATKKSTHASLETPLKAYGWLLDIMNNCAPWQLSDACMVGGWKRMVSKLEMHIGWKLQGRHEQKHNNKLFRDRVTEGERHREREREREKSTCV